MYILMFLYIYTWNILNPLPYISKMSWKKLTTNSANIAEIDYKRYFIYRSNIILKIIQYWLFRKKYPTIICLQEIPKDLLDQLLVLYSSNNISYSSDIKKNDYRVTIVNNCEIIKTKNILINNYKNILLTTIKVDNTKIYECANVHFHWSWKLDDLDNAAILLKDNLDESLPFIIVGDFNKPIELLESFMNQFDCVQFNKINNKYTSHLTHLDETNKLGIIDHILLSSEFNTDKNTKLKILSKILKYKIFYNFQKILKFKKLTPEIWIKERKNKDISDHKPVRLKILLI